MLTITTIKNLVAFTSAERGLRHFMKLTHSIHETRDDVIDSFQVSQKLNWCLFLIMVSIFVDYSPCWKEIIAGFKFWSDDVVVSAFEIQLL